MAINMWKKKSSLLSGLEENSRPKSAPASGSSSSKFFVTKPRPFKLSTEVRAEERKVLDHKRREEESLKDKLRQKELVKQRKANEEEESKNEGQKEESAPQEPEETKEATEKLEEKPKEHIFRKYNSLAGKYWREKL